VFLDRLREFGRRAAYGVDAALLQAPGEGFVLASRRGFASDAIDDLLRRPGWRDIAVPGERAEARVTLLGHRRHIGHLLGALVTGDSEHLQLALVVRQDL